MSEDLFGVGHGDGYAAYRSLIVASERKLERRGEQGHLMAALMLMIAIMLIMSTVVTQKWVDLLQREQEAEMMFRAKSMSHAIRRYRRDTKGQTQPLTELKMLMEPGSRGQYFLRKLYEDPLVKDGQWGLLYAGPGGQIVDPNSASAETPFAIGGSSSGFTSQQSVGGLTSTESGTRAVGGLPIVGVKSLCKKPTFRVHRGFTEYREWQFTVYDVDMQARQQDNQGGTRAPAAPGTSATNPNAPRGGR